MIGPRGIRILFFRELSSYFLSPMAYTLAGLFTLITGWLFFNYLVAARTIAEPSVLTSVIQPLYGNINLVFLFLAPLITMKLFAEEKRQNTIELLFASPLSNFDIILAKFLASMVLVSFMLGLTILFPLSLGLSGYNEWMIVASSCVGVLLCLCVYISIGLFSSSLTNNPTIAALISFCILFFLLLLILAPQAFQNPLIGEILQFISPATHYEGFSRGVLKSYSLLYYLFFTGFMFLLTKVSLDSRNW